MKYIFTLLVFIYTINSEAQIVEWIPYTVGMTSDTLYQINPNLPTFLEIEKDTIYSIHSTWGYCYRSSDILKKRLEQPFMQIGDSVIYVYCAFGSSIRGYFYKKIENYNLSLKVLNSRSLIEEVNKQIDALGLHTQSIDSVEHKNCNAFRFFSVKDGHYSLEYEGFCEIRNSKMEIYLKKAYYIGGNTPAEIVDDFIKKNPLKNKIILSKKFFTLK